MSQKEEQVEQRTKKPHTHVWVESGLSYWLFWKREAERTFSEFVCSTCKRRKTDWKDLPTKD